MSGKQPVLLCDFDVLYSIANVWPIVIALVLPLLGIDVMFSVTTAAWHCHCLAQMNTFVLQPL